ncbi:hypothetical protein [Pikeienuella sp. HZG-20]|uniref:hypothetical protein n=1 Tax=Paludibacillus litoralis TaxID=3133267 RepID=UPI0030EC6AE3
MRDIFLGKPAHWLIVAVLAGLGWGAGLARLHVTDFNLFVIGLTAVSAVALALVIWTSGADERVTRDPIEEDEDEDDDA